MSVVSEITNHTRNCLMLSLSYFC